MPPWWYRQTYIYISSAIHTETGVNTPTQRENLLNNAKEVLKRKNSVVLVLCSSQPIANLHGNATIGGNKIIDDSM